MLREPRAVCYRGLAGETQAIVGEWSLTRAFALTLKDPQFLADAEKMGIEVQHAGGEAIQALLEKIYASPKEVLEQAKAVAE